MFRRKPHRGCLLILDTGFDWHGPLHAGDVRAYISPISQWGSAVQCDIRLASAASIFLSTGLHPAIVECWTIFTCLRSTRGQQPLQQGSGCTKMAQPSVESPGDARGVGVGQCQEYRSGALREIFHERSGHWSQGTLYFYSALIDSSVGGTALTINRSTGTRIFITHS